MALAISDKVRFDDNDVAPDGVCYSGFDYFISGASEAYCVRQYDDEPNSVTLIMPESVSNTKRLRTLVDFLTSTLKIDELWLATDSSATYDQLDLSTLDLIPDCEA